MALLLVAASVVALLLLQPATPRSGVVVVERDGAQVLRQPLSRDASYPIGDALTVRVEDGGVWVEQSSCPDKLCEGMGVLRSVGPSIVCLPNRISVRVEQVPGAVDVLVR